MNISVTLDSGRKNNLVLKELLQARGIKICEGAQVCFVPRGQQVPEQGIVLIYNPDDIDGLIQLIDSIKNLSDSSDNLHVIGRREEGYTIVPLENILYFEAMGNNVYCKTESDRFEIQKKLYEIEKEFSSLYFIRINKSYIINFRWIDEIFPWFGSRLLLKCKETGEKLFEFFGSFLA